MSKNHPPRKGDLPRAELAKAAEDALKQFPRGRAYVQFKFTCPECGTRCTFLDKNSLWEEGECYQCGAKAPVTHGGFALMFSLGTDQKQG